MKQLLANRIVRALIVVAIVTLIVVGIAYAYETLWSGKARITIEAPTSEGQGELEITSVEALSNGTWDEALGLWTVSIARGESADLRVRFRNIGSDAVSYFPYIDNHELNVYVAPGVFMQTTGDLSLLAAGEDGYIKYSVRAEADAEPGTLPEIRLEIRAE